MREKRRNLYIKKKKEKEIQCKVGKHTYSVPAVVKSLLGKEVEGVAEDGPGGLDEVQHGAADLLHTVQQARQRDPTGSLVRVLRHIVQQFKPVGIRVHEHVNQIIRGQTEVQDRENKRYEGDGKQNGYGLSGEKKYE